MSIVLGTVKDANRTVQQIACECVAALTLKLVNSRPLEALTLKLVNLVSTTKEETAKRQQVSDRLVGLKERGK